MKKTGVLCASDTELAPFLKAMEVRRVTEKARLKFYEGTIEKIYVIAAYSGVETFEVNCARASERTAEITMGLLQGWG